MEIIAGCCVGSYDDIELLRFGADGMEEKSAEKYVELLGGMLSQEDRIETLTRNSLTPA